MEFSENFMDQKVRLQRVGEKSKLLYLFKVES